MSGSMLILPERHRVTSGPNATARGNISGGRFILPLADSGGRTCRVTLDVDDGIASGTGWERVTVHHDRHRRPTTHDLEAVRRGMWTADAVVMQLHANDEALLQTRFNGIHLWRDISARTPLPLAGAVEAGWTPPGGWA